MCAPTPGQAALKSYSCGSDAADRQLELAEMDRYAVNLTYPPMATERAASEIWKVSERAGTISSSSAFLCMCG